MGDASWRKDEGILRICACALLSFFLCWLIATSAQPNAGMQPPLTDHSGMRYLALKETGLYLAVAICRVAALFNTLLGGTANHMYVLLHKIRMAPHPERPAVAHNPPQQEYRE
jgi:hypothetical protein